MIPFEARSSKKALIDYCFSYIEDNAGHVKDRDILTALHALNYAWDWDENNEHISNVHLGAIRTARILSISDDLEETMDLTVEATHSYVANGIVSHNTANLPSDYTIEQYSDLFNFAHSQKLKGFTSFNPKGSMKPILSAKPATSCTEPRQAVKRPKELPCSIYTTTLKGQKYIILIGLLEGAPYEIFMSEYTDDYSGVGGHTEGTIKKVKKGQYQLIIKNGEEKIIIESITNVFNTDYEALNRLLSTSLRHGTPVEFIIDQLSKSGHFGTWGKTISTILKKYLKEGERVKVSAECENCGSTDLIYIEGCRTCKACGSSKCG